MTFNKGDIITIVMDDMHLPYIVIQEETRHGIRKILCFDDEGVKVYLTKNTVIKRIISDNWFYEPCNLLPDELFTL